MFVFGCGCVVAGRAVPRAPWVGGGVRFVFWCGAVAGCASAAGDVRRSCRPVADNWCPRMLRPHIPPRPLRPVDHPAPARGGRPFRGARNGASNRHGPARDDGGYRPFQGRGELREQPRRSAVDEAPRPPPAPRGAGNCAHQPQRARTDVTVDPRRAPVSVRPRLASGGATSWPGSSSRLFSSWSRLSSSLLPLSSWRPPSSLSASCPRPAWGRTCGRDPCGGA